MITINMHGDPYTTILLSIQKQVGDLSRETGEQTEKLESIETQTKITNGRVTKTEGDIRVIQDRIIYRKGRSAFIGALTGIAMAIIIGLLTAWGRKLLGV